MDYYFQDQLRWTYGFDNPNKTAALVATLLPLVWMLYALAWKIPQKYRRWSLITLGSVGVLAGWGLLVMTYSRGGLVAAFLAMGYAAWQTRTNFRLNRARSLISAGMAVLILGLLLSTGAARRSTQWITAREGSVENRFEIWQGGLRMLWAVPQGVGTGNSGNFYMQWFQPLESTARYRTLVNSYLTFATEQGVWIFLACVFGLVLFWSVSRPVRDGSRQATVIVSLRASLVAFAVAGFFSTTMEELWLWAVPGGVAIGLTGLSLSNRRQIEWRKACWQAVRAVALMGGLGFLIGGYLSQTVPLAVSLHGGTAKGGAILLTPKRPTNLSLQFAVDEKVMGKDHGKLLRRLAISNNLRILVGAISNPQFQRNPIMLAGDQVTGLRDLTGRDCILLVPATVSQERATQIFQQAKSIKLFLPDFDEDGRVAFWKEKVESFPRNYIHVMTLVGVGTQIEWAWDAVVEQVPVGY